MEVRTYCNTKKYSKHSNRESKRVEMHFNEKKLRKHHNF